MFGNFPPKDDAVPNPFPQESPARGSRRARAGHQRNLAWDALHILYPPSPCHAPIPSHISIPCHAPVPDRVTVHSGSPAQACG